MPKQIKYTMGKSKDANRDTMLTTDQLAERWKLTPDHLEVRRMRGEGPPWVKLGDDARAPVRYRLEDIIAYESSKKRTSTKPKRKR